MNEEKYKRVYDLVIDGEYGIEEFKAFIEKEIRKSYDQGFEAGYERGYYNSITMRKRGC
jgi:hypothetical protein